MKAATILAVLLAAASACAPVVRVHVPDGQHTDTIKQTADVLGVRIRIVDRPGSGVVLYEFRDADGSICGEALEKTIPDTLRETLRDGIKCELHGWSCNRVHFVAHEPGHIFGLSHVDADGNLMQPAPRADSTLTKAQRAQVYGLAHAFSYACWDGPAPQQVSP